MKSKSRYSVPTIDVGAWPRLGPYLTPPPSRSAIDYSAGFDFRIGDGFVRSIGRAERDMKLEIEHTTYIVPAGTVLVSAEADLYQRDGFECLWLR